MYQTKSERESIADRDLSLLQAERERTNVGPVALVSHFDDLPRKLTAGMIEKWVRGEVMTAPAGYVELVLEKYRSLPDAPDGIERPLQAGCILITDQMRRELESELERTGASLASLIRRKPPELRKFRAMHITHWRVGRANSANKEAWHYVMGALSSLPDRRS